LNHMSEGEILSVLKKQTKKELINEDYVFCFQ
jgi:hypothetical protein